MPEKVDITGAVKVSRRKRSPTPKQSYSEQNNVLLKQSHDWAGLLLPIFITIGLSVVANIAVGIWQGATFKAQVGRMADHQVEQDTTIKQLGEAIQAIITRLPIDYVPRAEHERSDVLNKELRDQESARMTSIESKLAQLILLQGGKK